MTTHRFLLALSLLGIGCSGSSSLGSDGSPLTSAGAGGGTSAGAGGTAVAAGAGGGAQGGTKAGAGTGGSSTAGQGAGATGSVGVDPSPGGSSSTGGSSGTGGSGASAGMGGGTAGGGTSGSDAGGTGGGSAGTAGMGQAGEGPISVDMPAKVEDPDATGDGPCAAKTAREVLDAIHEAYPEFADITDFYDPMNIGVSKLVYPYTSEAGYSLVLARGAGDCPAGCTDWDYYYFQTDESCVPQQVGSYSAHFGPCNGYTVRGTPMWGMPEHTPTAICSDTI